MKYYIFIVVTVALRCYCRYYYTHDNMHNPFHEPLTDEQWQRIYEIENDNTITRTQIIQNVFDYLKRQVENLTVNAQKQIESNLTAAAFEELVIFNNAFSASPLMNMHVPSGFFTVFRKDVNGTQKYLDYNYAILKKSSKDLSIHLDQVEADILNKTYKSHNFYC
uniref:SEA domain-containing protein n=1 Tax=Strongyloides papillosus TaxID=174720 RepID=A0A0N5BXV9_STREA